MEESTDIKLSRDEALVLLDLVARWTAENRPELPFEHPAEEFALWALECALESVLVEPFATGYLDVLEKARASLARRYGDSAL